MLIWKKLHLINRFNFKLNRLEKKGTSWFLHPYILLFGRNDIACYQHFPHHWSVDKVQFIVGLTQRMHSTAFSQLLWSDTVCMCNVNYRVIEIDIAKEFETAISLIIPGSSDWVWNLRINCLCLPNGFLPVQKYVSENEILFFFLFSNVSSDLIPIIRETLVVDCRINCNSLFWVSVK